MKYIIIRIKYCEKALRKNKKAMHEWFKKYTEARVIFKFRFNKCAAGVGFSRHHSLDTTGYS